MQKQKTLTKWLAIILLCSVAVCSYVLYDVLYLKKQEDQATANDGQSTEDILPDEDISDDNTPEEHIPYYTTLPRYSETIDGLTVTHFGGENNDTLLDVINFGKKRFAIFSSSSIEFDMREKGLAIAVIDEAVEKVVTLDKSSTYIDGKMSSYGVAILTKTDADASLYFINTNGDIKAQIALPYFAEGKLYLSGQSLLLFTISNGYLNSYKIADNLTLVKSPFMLKTDSTNINSVFDFKGGQALILDSDNEMSIYTFEQNKGFNKTFQEHKLSFKQIITAGTGDECNYIIYGKSLDTLWIYAFNKSFEMICSKTINGASDGVILPYSDGFIFVGNGVTKSYCKHLDEVLSYDNNLAFKNVVSLTYGGGSVFAVVEGEFGAKSLLYIDGDMVLTKPFDYSAEVVSVAHNQKGFSLYLNTQSTLGIFRANFGKTDPFIIDLDLAYMGEAS